MLGRKAGYKAALWGVAISTLPDLDVLLYPFLDAASELRFHRGFTHSFLFLILASPILGSLINRIHKKDKVGWRSWTMLSFWTLLSHIIIDIPTSFGTQVFEPFSSYLVTTDSIFIIDPVFTLILVVSVAIALFQRRHPHRRYLSTRIGLVLAALYLVGGGVAKLWVNSVFDSSFREQYGAYERMKTIPGPFTTLMWMGHIERNDSLYTATFSFFDDDRDLEFTGVSKNSHLLTPYRGDYPLETLLWFTMGYYKMERSEQGEIHLHDVRFARTDYWLTDDADYVWSNRLILDEDSIQVVDFHRTVLLFDTNLDVEDSQMLWRRFRGEEYVDSDSREGSREGTDDGVTETIQSGTEQGVRSRIRGDGALKRGDGAAQTARSFWQPDLDSGSCLVAPLALFKK